MATYEKDATGRIALNCGKTMTAIAHGEPGRGARNHSGRVFVKDGAPLEVIVRDKSDGQEWVVADFPAVAKSVGKMCSVYVRVRAEAEVGVPKDPALEPAEMER